MGKRILAIAAAATMTASLAAAAPAVAGGDAPPTEPATGQADITFGPHESGTKTVVLPPTAAQAASARKMGIPAQGARETVTVGSGTPKASGAGGATLTVTVSPARVVATPATRLPGDPARKVHRKNFSQRWCWPPGPLGEVFACERHKGHVYYDGKHVWENHTFRHRKGRHLCGLESGVAGSTHVKHCLNYHHISRRFTSMWDIFTINYALVGGINSRDTIGAWVHVGTHGKIATGDRNLD